MGPDQLLSLITNKLINHIALLLWNFVKKASDLQCAHWGRSAKNVSFNFSKLNRVKCSTNFC